MQLTNINPIVGYILFILMLFSGCSELPEKQKPLRIIVMDPLAAPLACDCVSGYAQRRYDLLIQEIKVESGRDTSFTFIESLNAPLDWPLEQTDIIIGPLSTVTSDAAEKKLQIRTIAMLSGMKGSITHTGLFVVHKDSPLKSISELTGKSLVIGPPDSDASHAAALATLESFGIPYPAQNRGSQAASTTAALAAAEDTKDAAVIPSDALPLIVSCGALEKGDLRVIGKTDNTPFIAVFATGNLPPASDENLVKLLKKTLSNSELRKQMESARGFIALPPITSDQEWRDWRGGKRNAITPDIPVDLPRKPLLLWNRTLTAPAMAGIALGSNRIIVADKNFDETEDVFRALDADTGREYWSLRYPAKGDMDFTNTPRATPVIKNGLVYLLGAFGDLHCVELFSGKTIWKTNLSTHYKTKPPAWGWSSAPLVIDNKLIINPGAADASLVALDRMTGKELWRTPGNPPGYAAFISATFKGVRQIVGYDSISLGGWNPLTGKRLWTITPCEQGDFNVPTPIDIGDKLLVATENNGTRLYGFDDNGLALTTPLAESAVLAPDTSTPIVINDMVVDMDSGLRALSISGGLKKLWEHEEDAFSQYASLIAGNDRILILSIDGTVMLIHADSEKLSCIAKQKLFTDAAESDPGIWSHPVVAGSRLYVRTSLGIYCFLLKE